MLRSPKLREAMDLSKEDPKRVERYTRNVPPKTRYPSGNAQHFLLARRLVEAGVPIVHFNFGYWDWHGENFVAGRQQIPMLDARPVHPARRPARPRPAGLDHRAGPGRNGPAPEVRHRQERGPRPLGLRPVRLRGRRRLPGRHIVGATDKIGAQVTDKFYKVESFGRTLYHLLGIDPDTIVTTPANRPVQADRGGCADHQGGDPLAAGGLGRLTRTCCPASVLLPARALSIRVA